MTLLSWLRLQRTSLTTSSLLCFSLLLVSHRPHSAYTQTLQSSPSSDSVKQLLGIVYTKGTHGDLLADMFLPSNAGLRPAVIYIHGGAWNSGDRTQLRPVAMSLAEHGYVGMAIDYDLTTRGDRFPVALNESERAVQWLRQNATRYQVDPQRIAIAGSSAGGELAALVALDEKSASDAGVQAAIVFNGVLDLSEVGPDPLASTMVSPYLGGECATVVKVCNEASPVARVHSGAPPFFVGHGTADRIVPYSQAVRFNQLLEDNHVQVTLFTAAGAGHTYWKSPQWLQPNLEAVLRFLSLQMPKQ